MLLKKKIELENLKKEKDKLLHEKYKDLGEIKDFMKENNLEYFLEINEEKGERLGKLKEFKRYKEKLDFMRYKYNSGSEWSNKLHNVMTKIIILQNIPSNLTKK